MPEPGRWGRYQGGGRCEKARQSPHNLFVPRKGMAKIMKFHVLTLFPELIDRAFHTSITGRALEQGSLELHTVNIRDYAGNKHQKVDDYPYGGGAGMVMQAEPVYQAYESVRLTCAKKPRVIYVTPQGQVFCQRMARELAREEELVVLCGHYEGVDERVLEEIVTDYISIGDYVLTGGELAALVMMDAVSRLVPGVLNNEESAEFESFHKSLLEYPQYSRPEVWHEKRVPKELCSGNHKSIEAWRLLQAEKRTRERRPDLYRKYERRMECEQKLLKSKLLHMDMLEPLRTDRARILYFDEKGVMLLDEDRGICYVSAEDAKAGEELLGKLRETVCPVVRLLVLHQDFLPEIAGRLFDSQRMESRIQYVYTQKNPLPRRYEAEVKSLDHGEEGQRSAVERLLSEQGAEGREAVGKALASGRMYGAFVQGKLTGILGQNEAGALDFLYVEEAWRRRGIGRALETALVNRLLQEGRTPYVWVRQEDEGGRLLQERLGLYPAKGRLWLVCCLRSG